jgi:ferric-dicitrate binding protein FerR (iron transport regulator)
MKKSEKKLQDQLVEIKQIRKKIDLYKNIDVDAGYIKTNYKINHHVRKQSILKAFNKIAAILLLPLLISTLFLLYYINTAGKDETTPVLYTEIKAAPGTIIRTELPDESIVWLNSSSSLRYPNHFFGDKRKVELMGEGFFEVQTNPDFPFEVNTASGLQITARGTAFNVYAYEDEPNNEIVLQHGAVDVKYKNEYLTMKPDEMIILDKTNSNHWTKKTNINAEEKIAWKNGRLIFRNTPLDEVMRKLSRRYNVDITLHNRKNENYRVRATFTNETITQILDYLKMSVSIEWSLSEVEQNTDATFTKQHIDVRIK